MSKLAGSIIRLIRGQTWLTGILILLFLPTAFAETDFSTSWKTLRSAVIAGDKTAVSEMPYLVRAVKNKPEFLRRYDELFKGEANAAQCFSRTEPQKDSSGQYEIYCPFKGTRDDKESAPIRFLFELTKHGWKFAGLDNINE
jgi:hypothetical protein